MRTFLLLICAVMAAAADPTIAVDAVRMPIAGRRVICFAIYADQELATALTITVAYGGTASSPADFTASTSITLPEGMPTTQAIYIGVDTTNPNADGKNLILSIQEGTGYEVHADFGTASTTIACALSANEVYAMGEPSVVEVAAGSVWSYTLNVHHPSQLQDSPMVPVPIFAVFAEAAPGSGDYSAIISATEQTAIASDAVPFLITVTTSAGDAGKQFRFRLKIQVDVDGDQHYVPYQTPTSTGASSEDIYTEQDIVLMVTVTGPG